MSLRGGTIVAVGALSVALLLSGCAASPPPARTADPVASTAPTATPAAVYPTCATMAPPSTLAAIAPGLALQPPKGYSIAPPADNAAPGARAEFMTAVYPPSATTVLAGLQAGYFDCEWRDSPTAHYVRISVVPGRSAAFESYAASTTYNIATFDGLAGGSRSLGGCLNGDGPSCEISTLSGTTWVTVTESDGDISAASAPAIRANLEAIVRSTLAAVNAAGPLVSAQQQPSSAWHSVSDCSPIDAAVRSITGSAGGAAEKRMLDDTDAYDPVFRAAVAQSGAFDCVDTEAHVTIVPGGDVTAPIVYTSDSTTPVPVSIPGVVGARDLCAAFDATACWTEGYIDHALVTISGDLTASGRHAELAAIAVAIAG